MTSPSFTSLPVAELPPLVRTSTIADADKAVAASVAAILATGQAAKSGAEFGGDDPKKAKRSATDAGTKIKGHIKRLGAEDQTFPYHGAITVRTLTLTPSTFTFALVPVADDVATIPTPSTEGDEK